MADAANSAAAASGAAAAAVATPTAAAAAQPQPSDAAASSVAPAASPYDDVLVQYVVMRGDLIKAHKWNVGGLIANGSHACVSVLMANLRDAEVTAYTDPAAAAQMHKVVLSAKDESELVDTAELLQKNSIKHVLWTEQPEHMRTCLAVRPYPRKIIQPLLKHLKLFR